MTRQSLPFVVCFILIHGCLGCHHATEPRPSSDTTNHNIAWHTYTFGDGASSALRSVAIVNNTLMFAVGELHFKDSAGGWDPLPYNAAVWDGNQWQVRRITVAHNGDLITLPLDAVFAFSPSDIWVSGGVPMHWNGSSWTLYHLFDMGVLSITDGDILNICGTTTPRVYFVGRKGTVVYYDGSAWQKIPCSTTLDIVDMYAGINTKSGANDILAVASQFLVNSAHSILRISGTTADTISSMGVPYSLNGVWFVPGQHYYVVGDGIYEKNSLQDTSWRNGPRDITPYHTYAVRGVSANDIFVCGDFGELLHFNGNSWHSYIDQIGLPMGIYYSVSANANTVVAVGENNGRGVIAVGSRSP